MDNNDPVGIPFDTMESSNQQNNNDTYAIKYKKSLVNADFTVHSMPDSSWINTQERVCKGMDANLVFTLDLSFSFSRRLEMCSRTPNIHFHLQMSQLLPG